MHTDFFFFFKKGNLAVSDQCTNLHVLLLRAKDVSCVV